eukprot:713689_1
MDTVDWTCDCGAEISAPAKNMEGAKRTHLNSKRHKQAMTDRANKQSNKDRWKKWSGKESNDGVDGVMFDHNNNSNQPDVDVQMDDRHDKADAARDGVETETDNIYINHKIVTIDTNNAIIQMEEGGKVCLKRCHGIIPPSLKGRDVLIGRYLPFKEIQKIENRLWWISGDAFHHRNCRGLVIDETLNNPNLNVKCAELLDDNALDNMIKEACRPRYKTQQNVRMNFDACQDKLAANAKEMARLRK